MKRRIALLLAIVMVMGLLPVHVSAAEDSVETPLLQETEIQDVLPQEEEAQTDLLPEAETIVPEAEVVLPEAPVSLVGLEWTEDMGMVWTLPEENAGFDLYEIEIMYAEQAVDNPAESWQTTDAFTVAAGAFADEAAWDEVGSYSRFVIGTHGGGWYYFRVKAASAARSDAETGIWAYSDGLAVEATAELRLHDNNDYSTSPVTMTGTIGATVDLSGYSRDTQARYFAFASAANLAAWNTKADGSGDDYMTAEILTLNGDLDLYGRWVGMKIGIGNDYYPADESASGDGWFYGGDDTLYLDGYTGGMIYAPRGMTIIVDGENTVTGDIICEEDLHITVQASASLTLAGCVLSGDFELIANGNMTITTDAFTAVDVQNDVYMTGSGMIEIEAQETAIVCDGLTIPSTMMIFCHPQQITPSFEYEGEAYIRLEKKASLILSDPDWAGEEGHTPTWSLDGETDPGLIGGYEVRYYFSEDENTIPDPEDWIGWYDYEDGEPVALPDQLLAKYGSGYYRFDVRPYPIHPGMAAGQWTEISPAAYFETAAERLSVSDVAWVDGRTFSWTNDFENTALVDYYEVAIYYGEDENSVDTDQYVSVQYYTHDDLPVSLWNSTLKNNGAGYYAFRVRPISVDPMQALSGDWSELSELYYFAGPTDVAPQAYDLQWSEQGEVSFIPVLPEGEEWVRFEIEIFRREAGGEVGILGLNVGYNSEWTDEERVTENVFADTSEMYQSGTYYFTVTTIGDGIVMADSAPVCSADWTYVCPDRQLEVIDPVWNEDMSISWTDNVAAGIEHYEVQFQVVTEGAVLDPEDWDDWEYYYPDEETYMLSENVYQNLGSGTYYFRVMAYPAGIYEARPSEWSEWSAGFEYTMPELTLNATDLAWNEETMEMTWSLGEADPAWVDHYSIRFYYSEESAPTANEYDKRYSRIVRTEDLSYMLPAYDLADYGAGYYAFSIRAYSKDLSKAFSGSYSELSPALYFAGPSEKAPQASDLAWNVYRKNETSSMEEMGTISFKNPCYDAEERPYTEFWVDIYRKEASGDLLIGSFTTNTSNAYRNSYPFDMLPEMYESGIYYFTVR